MTSSSAVHDNAVSCLTWSSGVLATGSWDCTARVWSCTEVDKYKIKIGSSLKCEIDHDNKLTAVALDK